MKGLILSICLAAAQGAAMADGVTRSVEPVAGGCRVTLTWEFAGSVESGLVIEERLAQGWSVDDSTVSFASLDASWFSGNVARFAVKPSLLVNPGSISFTVVSAAKDASGAVAGDWMMYLDGALSKGRVGGASALAALSADAEAQGGATGPAGSAEKAVVEKTLAIASFKMLGGGVIELSYRAAIKGGVLVVEGCAGLGKAWTEVKRMAVAAEDGTVRLESGEAEGCRFFRMKLLTEA